MPTYKLEYTLNTGIIAGETWVYSRESAYSTTFEAADDADAISTAASLWLKVLYERKEPGAAVKFVGLFQEVAWKPDEHQVVWQKPGEPRVFFS